MNRNKNIEMLEKIMKKSPRFAKMLKQKLKNKNKSRQKSKQKGGSGLKDKTSFNTNDSVSYEIIKDKEATN